ncbi:MAG TPA: SAM-dependent methyltransferase, partial [Chloroflexota bacterium]|nr:SAM-dependent methyltransferase [Chloroflexota bacterium]
FSGPDVAEQTAQLLALPFKNIRVESRDESLQVQLSAAGKALVRRGKPPNPQHGPDLAHDRRKQLTLPAGKRDAFLQEVGIMAADGSVRAERQRKFRQINEFLKLVGETIEHGGGVADFTATDGTLSIVDCGCGNAYLSFATYHYFAEVLGVPTALTGVDVNGELLAAHADKIQRLGWTGLKFEASPIVDFSPLMPPAIVLALHACDTATDEALARAIRWGTRAIFCAPCCHHHLQQQLSAHRVAPPLPALLRHPVLSERLGDILTDTFRSLILRIMGYQTEIVEFVSSEHTAKNLLIRAVKRGQGRPAVAGRDPAALKEYRALKELWQVTPYLEALLGAAFAQPAEAEVLAD